MYQLFARIFGSNNLPDSSNMCHESSSVGLPESIGAAVGTAILSDFEKTDCIFYIGQNVGTSSPRLLHDLQDAVDRGVADRRHQSAARARARALRQPAVARADADRARDADRLGLLPGRGGGDIAALMGICKALIAADDALKASGARKVAGDDDKPEDPGDAAAVAFAKSMAAADRRHVLDHDFIAEHTHGFEAFAVAAARRAWEELERCSGLTRAEMTAAADDLRQPRRGDDPLRHGRSPSR